VIICSAGQIRRQPGLVIADIEDDQNLRVTLAPLPGGDQPG